MENTETVVRALVSEIGGIPVDADATADLYLDLGMASVHALQLLAEIEERFGLHVPDDDFVEANSIRRLTLMLDRLQGKEGAMHAGSGYVG